MKIASWPLWLKIGAALFIAVALTGGLLLAVSLNSASVSDREYLSALLVEGGTRQYDRIQNALAESAAALESFSQNEANRAAIIDLFSTDENLEEVQNLIREELIQGEIFTRVWLVRPNGTLLLSEARPGFALTYDTPDQQEAILRGLIRGLSRDSSPGSIVVAQRDGEVRMEFAQTISNEQGRVSGFIIAALDIEQVIYPHLETLSEDIPTTSFLFAPPDIFISPTEEFASLESVSTAANQFVSSGVLGYVVDEREVIGFAIPATGLSNAFRFVMQVDANIATARFQNELSRVSFPVIIGLAALIFVLALLLHQLISPPLHDLRQAITAMLRGDFERPLAYAGRQDEIGELSASFVEVRQQVKTLTEALSRQIADRERAIRLTQEVGRLIAESQQGLKPFLNQVIELIIARFPQIYHAQVFLIDRERRYAMLEASTGEAGQKLLASGHRLAVGSISVIGQVTELGQVIAVRDAAASDVHRVNPNLPETRGELAIPLRVGNVIIGALDVQSKQVGAFDGSLIEVLQTLADQVSAAVQYSQLTGEAPHPASPEAGGQYRTRRAWEEFMGDQYGNHFASHAGTETETDFSSLKYQAIKQKKVVVGKMTPNQTIPIAVPIRLRGNTLGAVVWELPERDFDANKVLLAEELVSRLAISLDNARLFYESQRATERERIVNAITAKLSGQSDIDAILETAVQEVGRAMQTPLTHIRLHHNQESNGDAAVHPNGELASTQPLGGEKD